MSDKYKISVYDVLHHTSFLKRCISCTNERGSEVSIGTITCLQISLMPENTDSKVLSFSHLLSESSIIFFINGVQHINNIKKSQIN